MTRFKAGDRVRVSEAFHWARSAMGTVSVAPEAVVRVTGPWDDEGLTRSERSQLGVITTYWIWFDEAQLDADGDGPYQGGSIWESALSLLTVQ